MMKTSWWWLWIWTILNDAAVKKRRGGCYFASTSTLSFLFSPRSTSTSTPGANFALALVAVTLAFQCRGGAGLLADEQNDAAPTSKKPRSIFEASLRIPTQ